MLTVGRIRDAYRRLGFTPAADVYLDEGARRCCPVAAVCLAEGRLQPRELTPPVAWRNVIAALDEPSPYTIAFIDSVNRWGATDWGGRNTRSAPASMQANDPALLLMARGWRDGERVASALLGPLPRRRPTSVRRAGRR